VRADADDAVWSAASAGLAPLAEAKASQSAVHKGRVRGANQGREIKGAKDMVSS
jgi:hypothetical protein